MQEPLQLQKSTLSSSTKVSSRTTRNNNNLQRRRPVSVNQVLRLLLPKLHLRKTLGQDLLLPQSTAARKDLPRLSKSQLQLATKNILSRALPLQTKPSPVESEVPLLFAKALLQRMYPLFSFDKLPRLPSLKKTLVNI